MNDYAGPRSDTAFRVEVLGGGGRGDGAARVAPVQRALAIVSPLVREQIDTHPLRTLGVAALVGFAIGGGLSSRLARFALMVAARYAGRHVWREVMTTALGNATRALPQPPLDAL